MQFAILENHETLLGPELRLDLYQEYLFPHCTQRYTYVESNFGAVLFGSSNWSAQQYQHRLFPSFLVQLSLQLCQMRNFVTTILLTSDKSHLEYCDLPKLFGMHYMAKKRWNMPAMAHKYTGSFFLVVTRIFLMKCRYCTAIVLL